MIYFDSAATTLQKPPQVEQAVRFAMTHYASPGRGGYTSAMQASDAVYACREEAAALAEDMALSLTAPEYGAEPFVLPADIAYAPGKEGRAGWSWYTGAAGWYLRLLRELYGETP